MDERILKELGLLPVARLCGLATAKDGSGAGPATDGEPRAEAPARRRSSFPPEPARAAATVRLPDTGRPGSPEAAMGWEELREAVRSCRKCVLCEQRKQAVFGVGDESAPWLFVGEGPGADEDAQGEPFVGQAGKLLDNMLAAIGLARGRGVFIANVVKCRPPGNRTPTPEEAAACAPYLDRQIELLRPRLIVALGKTAAMRLLATEASLASLRGKVHAYRGTPLVVTYHPAYLLRNLPDKAKAWEDLLFARRTISATAA